MHIIMATHLLRKHTQRYFDISKIKIDVGMKPIFTKHKTMTAAKRWYKPQFFMLNEGYNSYPIRILWVLFRSTSVKSQEKMLCPSNARPLFFSIPQAHTHMQRKRCRNQGHHLLTRRCVPLNPGVWYTYNTNQDAL